jgi:hypothetical protein
MMLSLEPYTCGYKGSSVFPKSFSFMLDGFREFLILFSASNYLLLQEERKREKMRVTSFTKMAIVKTA